MPTKNALVIPAALSGWVQGPTILWRYQCIAPTYAPDSSTLATAATDGFFGYTLTNGSTGESTFVGAGEVTFDPVAIGDKEEITVTVDGVETTVDYLTLAYLNGQACVDQYAKQQAAKAQAMAAAQPGE